MTTLFEWHDRYQEPSTGFWGLGQAHDATMALHAMAGSMHNFHLYYECNLPLPYQDRAIDYALGKRTRFTKNVGAVGLPAKHRVIRISETAAGPKLAEVFGIHPADPITLIVAAGEAGDRVLSVGEHYFPPAFAGIGSAVERTGSISLALTEFGIADYERLHSVITARLPDARSAMLLGQAETRPVLCVEYVNVAPGGRPVEFGRTHFPGDRLQLTVAHGESHD
jgi:GntR family phosphonate transport system transcriptional regulator